MMKDALYKKSKAQAMIELAILGPLVLVAAGILITYVAKVNNDQYYLMEAFRYGLKSSHDLNRPTGYGTYDDRPQVSINKPIIGEEMVSGGASYTMWAIPGVQDDAQEDPQSQVRVKANDWGDLPLMFNRNEHDVTDDGSTALTPTVVSFESEGVKVINNNGKITSRRSGGAAGVNAYAVGDNHLPSIVFFRGHGAARAFSADVSPDEPEEDTD